MSGCGGIVDPEETPTDPSFSGEDGACQPGSTPPSGAGPGDPEFPLPPEDPATPDEALGFGSREYFTEFNTSSHTLGEGASLLRRPDAVSFDYLTAFSLGPVDIGDVTGGAVNRVWRVRAVNDEMTDTGSIFLSRSNDVNTAWEAETLLFTYSGEALEVDLAFEQAARAVVTIQILDHIWIYWFKPAVSDFVLEDFGEGRTPRALLDNPLDTTNSDVLIFYINDTLGKLSFRQQRDLYAIVYDTPVTGIADKFIEDVVKTTDNRVVVLVSVHDTLEGTYNLERLESTLYPFLSDIDEYELGAAVLSGVLLVAVINYTTFDIDEYELGAMIQSGILALLLIDHVLFGVDEYDLGASILSGTLAVIVIEHTTFDIDEYDLAATVQSGVLVAIVIEHPVFDLDEYDLTATLQGGTLVVP